MYTFFLPLLLELSPALMMTFMAIEIFVRNPKNKQHQLTTGLVLAIAGIYFGAFLVSVLSTEVGPLAARYIKYNAVFITMTLGLYFLCSAGHLKINKYVLHAINLLPMTGWTILILNPAWATIRVKQTGILRYEDFGLLFWIILGSIVLYSVIWFQIYLYYAKRRLNDKAVMLKERERIRLIHRGYMMTVAFVGVIVPINILLITLGYSQLHFLSSFGPLIWAFYIRHAMVKYDLLSSTGRRYELLFELSHQGIVLLNETGRIVEANSAFERMAGGIWKGNRSVTFAELLGQDRLEFKEMYQKAFDQGAPFEWVTVLHREDREALTIEIHSDFLEMDGELIAFLVLHDITDQKEHERKLADLAYRDSLTGLGNRRFFIDRLQSEIDSANEVDWNKGFIVMMLDLDQFKWINDTLGHSAGDTLLKQIAEQLRIAMPQGGVVSRLGGDEFAVLYSGGCGEAEADQLARTIMKGFDKPFHISGKPYTISASIGICIVPRDGDNYEALLRNADTAMYYAKRNGRNQYQFYTPSLNMMAEQHLTLVRGLSSALQEGEFSLHYQPQVNLRDNRVYGVEALLRWNSKELGLVSPALFIPVAEEAGSIIQIGDWVLREAIRQAKEWVDKGHQELVVSVNISAHQLRIPGFAEHVAVLLEEAGLPPRNLCLEITESTAIFDVETSLGVCNQLINHGIGLAIDDFGTGYSSLSMLNRFPFHFVKIDRSLVQNISESKRDLAVIRTVVELSKDLGALVVAEGVELEEQVKLLRELGCQEAQGYWFGKPMPVGHITEYLEQKLTTR